ncbi:MAG: RnfABCDGE type electron transport complex subunit D, partial [Thermoplasmata archaeon]|nr:RnfABCDGE type electron transport complex subunit D [Thermoplasmata archaeon]
PQPWHVGTTLVDAAIIALLGLLLWSRATHSWRILVPYFLVNLASSVVIAEVLGGPRAVPIVLQATVLGSASLFFGFFMVSEPRTAPSARWAMLVFGGLVGLSAALLPTLFAERPAISALGVLAPYLALFLGNAFAVLLPSARGTRRPNARSTRVPGRAFARPLNPER